MPELSPAETVDLVLWARDSLPSAEVPCVCGPTTECLRCRTERVVRRLFHPVPEVPHGDQAARDYPTP